METLSRQFSNRKIHRIDDFPIFFASICAKPPPDAHWDIDISHKDLKDSQATSNKQQATNNKQQPTTNNHRATIRRIEQLTD